MVWLLLAQRSFSRTFQQRRRIAAHDRLQLIRIQTAGLPQLDIVSLILPRTVSPEQHYVRAVPAYQMDELLGQEILGIHHPAIAFPEALDP